MGVFCCCCFSNPSQFRDQFSLLTSFLHVTSILSVYYLSVQQLPYLLSIKSILKDYWETNPKFCCILHFYCLSTIFHSFIYPLFWLVPTLPPCSLLPLFESEFITQYFATLLAWLALPCSRSFAEVSPRLTQNIKSTPKISSMTGLFLFSFIQCWVKQPCSSSSTGLQDNIQRIYQQLAGKQPKSQMTAVDGTIRPPGNFSGHFNTVLTIIFTCNHLLWSV